ncbi:MAG TPA: hypothetical protein VFU36_01910 [Jatrophihabitans sp.]|nr:hypothetical protein [Jatrophihabitans sp.]
MTDDRYVTEPALWRSVGRGAAIGLAIGAVLELISLFGHTGGSPVLLIGVPLVSVVLLQLVRAGIGETPPPEPVSQSSRPRAEYFVRLRQLERRLDRACHDPSNYEWTVRPMLARLAAERLQAKHGVSVHRDPVHARELMGEPLWQIMTTAPERPSQPVNQARLRELVQAISRI